MLPVKKKILIIEDEINILDTTAEYLIMEGFNVVKAIDGEEGIRMANEHFPDLILCDINMPNVNGYDVYKALQKNYFTSLIPFIFLTAKAEKADIFKGMQLGANDYIVKPFDYDVLLNTINIRLQKHEQLLNTKEERFDAIVENASDWIWIADMYGKITFSNKECEAITGFTKDEIIGRSILDYLPVYEFADISVNTNNKTKKLKHTFEYIVKTKNNQEVNVEVTISIVLNNNNCVVGIAGNHRNITIRKQLESLERSVEITKKAALIKQQFLANMSHEMRTPLNCIIGMLEFLQRTELDEKQANYTETIKHFSETLLNIINDILDLAKIESGKFDLNKTNFHFSEIVENTKSVFNSLAKGKDVVLYENIDAEIPNGIYADKMRVNQIITNYMSNALKFTEKGSVTIKYSLLWENKIENKFKIKVEVIDTGKGIREDNINKLFNAYSQLENSRIKRIEGTGLGLSICKNLAELMNGEVGVNSELGKGSNFWFTFEAEGATNIQEPQEKNEDEKNYNNVKLNMKILLVEDKKFNQQMMTLQLKDAECEIDIAENGQEALDKYADGKYDVILMDIQMPIMDGIITTSILRERYPQLPPIIAVTADILDAGIKNIEDKGFDDYLPKPVSTEAIYSKLLKWKNR